MKKHESAVEGQIRAARTALQDAQRDHAERLLKFHEKPSDVKLQGELEALENEIAQHERDIQRLEGAKVVASRRDAADAKQAEVETLKSNLAGVEKRLERQAEVAAKLVETVAALAPLLAEYQTLADDQHRAGWAIVRGAFASSPKLAERNFATHFVRALRGSGAVPAVVDALYASGLGSTGLQLDPFVSVSAVRSSRPLAEQMQRDAQTVLSNLRRFVAQREAEMKGKTAAE